MPVLGPGFGPGFGRVRVPARQPLGFAALAALGGLVAWCRRGRWRWRGALGGTVGVRVFAQCGSLRGCLLQLWCAELLQLLWLCLGLRLGLGLGVCVCVLGSCVGLLRVHVRLCKSFLLGSHLLVVLQAHVSRRERVSGSANVPAAAHAEFSECICWLRASADNAATTAT